MIETLGDRIKKLRRQKKLSQQQLGKAIGVTREAVCQWEKGKTAPQGKRLEKLADVLGTTPGDLLFGEATKHLSTEETKLLEDWNILPIELQKDFANRIHILAVAIKQVLPDNL